MERLKSRKVWKIVRRPPMKNVIGSKWVLQAKEDEFGEIQLYKARLVAQGFRQQAGIDYVETFSPVLHRKSIRILMALAVENWWTIQHVDLVSAYLNSEIKEEVELEQPQGFEEKGKPFKYFICRLQKSMHALHQARRDWNLCVDRILGELGLISCVKEPCVYVGRSVIVGLFVHDLVSSWVRKKTSQISRGEFAVIETRGLGDASSFLSLAIIRRTGEGVRIGQPALIEDILMRNNLEDSMPRETVLSTGFDSIEKNESSQRRCTRAPYGPCCTSQMERGPTSHTPCPDLARKT